jgi:hypothetical protein
MLKKLFWRAPSYGTTVGYDPNAVQDKFRTLKDGSVVPIEVPKLNPDEGFCFLQAREEDLPDLHGALQWFCDQSEVPLFMVISKEKGIARLRIRGDFVPAPSVDDLSQVVSDYRLLGARFASWAEVIKRPAREVEALEALVLTLAQRSKGIDNGLLWAVRALEVRNEIRR